MMMETTSSFCFLVRCPRVVTSLAKQDPKVPGSGEVLMSFGF